jgi:hypothetical protein
VFLPNPPLKCNHSANQSNPAPHRQHRRRSQTLVTRRQKEQQQQKKKGRQDIVPVMVPWTVVPFLSSIVTVSLFSFIKNLHPNSAGEIARETNQLTTKKGEKKTNLGRGERSGSRGLPDELHLGGAWWGEEGEGGRGGAEA